MAETESLLSTCCTCSIFSCPYIYTDYAYSIYPAMSKSPKQLPNYLKSPEELPNYLKSPKQLPNYLKRSG